MLTHSLHSIESLMAGGIKFNQNWRLRPQASGADPTFTAMMVTTNMKNPSTITKSEMTENMKAHPQSMTKPVLYFADRLKEKAPPKTKLTKIMRPF